MIDVAAFAQQIVGPLETSEFLYSYNFVKKMEQGLKSNMEAGDSYKPKDENVKDLREILRLHRISTLAWLMQQGVKIPMELLADSTHPPVGKQLPDTVLPVTK